MPERNAVVLVDDEGSPIGVAEKLAAHTPPGQLHLAFSVFLFSADGQLLVQRRALSKYHFPGIWANSCCSHPQPGEDDLVLSAERRLAEELGIGGASPALVLRGHLESAGAFTYRAVDPVSGLVEAEYDHVLVGELTRADGASPGNDDLPAAAPDEVEALEWVGKQELRGLGEREGFAPWFAQALEIALGREEDAPPER